MQNRTKELVNTKKMEVEHPGVNCMKWSHYVTKVNTSGELREGEIRAPGLCGNDGVWMPQHVTKIRFSEEIAAHLRAHLDTGTQDPGPFCFKTK